MSEHSNEPHVGLPQYIAVFGVLVVCTVLTYLTAQMDLDSALFAGANTLLALVIAFFKMACVVLIFMHVWWNHKLIWLTVVGSFLFLIILFVEVLQDYFTRPIGNF